MTDDGAQATDGANADATDDADGRVTRALVLGGGGVAGIAWESAIVSALAAEGIDLSAADVVVGTSAGSVVGTALRSGEFDRWSAEIGRPRSEDAAAGPGTGPTPAPTPTPRSGSTSAPVGTAASDSEHAAYDAIADVDPEPVAAAFAAASESTAGERETRQELGRFARTVTLTRTEEASRARIGSLLPADDWPAATLRITVVDADDGSFRVIDAGDGVDLVSAVAASCAVPGVYPTITIDGRRYMDGGMRSATNADAASDCDRVLVLSCGPEPMRSPLGPSLPAAVVELRRTAEVLVVEADAASLAAFGSNSLLPTVGPAAAEAGARQAASVIDAVRAFWG